MTATREGAGGKGVSSIVLSCVVLRWAPQADILTRDLSASLATTPLHPQVFGYPTGLGALIVRKAAADLLRRHKRYFGGGTVGVSIADQDFFSRCGGWLSAYVSH